MAFRFAVAVFSVLAVATQGTTACLPLLPPPPPPPCALVAPPPPASLAALLPTLLGAFAPALPLPPSALSLPLSLLPPSARPLLPLPGALPCPVPPTRVTNRPDVNIPLPLPALIPVGKFCTCQKFAIRPSLLPCAPPPSPPVGSFPLPPPLAFLPSPPPAVLPPALLQTLLGTLAPSTGPACAPCTCV